MLQNRLFRALSGLLVVLLLAGFSVACTGEAGEGGTPTGLGSQSVAEVEYESFELANSERSDGGVTPTLRYREALAQVAREHSRSMREHDFFGHKGVNGDQLGDRLRAAGIPYSVAGENIVMFIADQAPAHKAHEILMGSSSHRRNILDSRFNRLGVGVARTGNQYWITQVYIRP